MKKKLSFKLSHMEAQKLLSEDGVVFFFFIRKGVLNFSPT